MAENEDGQERTEQASPKRLDDARQKGQIPRSRELASMGMLFVAATSLSMMGAPMIEGLGDVVRMSLNVDRAVIFNPMGGLEMLIESLIKALWLLLPFLIIMVMTAIAVSVALGGLAFSTQAMAFKIDKLNPLSGLKRIFDWFCGRGSDGVFHTAFNRHWQTVVRIRYGERRSHTLLVIHHIKQFFDSHCSN
jgi:flagellar biosynthetic protein FlhB